MTAVVRLRVVMPVHNAERYVGEAIQSVLDDLPTDAEVVIVDDGSSDGSVEIIDRYADRDPRIVVVRNESASGVSRALNLGISQPGDVEYIAVAEHDDVTRPGRFEAQIAALDSEPRLGAVSCEGRYVGPDGRVVGRVANGPRGLDEFDQQRNAGVAILVPHPCVTYRASALHDVGPYDETFDGAQDLELMNRLVYTGGWAMVILPVVGIYYRMHPESMSFAKLSAQRQMDRYIWYRNRRILDGEPYLSFADWSRQVPPLRTRLTRARKDQGALMYRRAGLAWLARRPLSFAVNIAGACLLHPRWVLLKLRVLRGG